MIKTSIHAVLDQRRLAAVFFACSPSRRCWAPQDARGYSASFYRSEPARVQRADRHRTHPDFPMYRRETTVSSRLRLAPPPSGCGIEPTGCWLRQTRPPSPPAPSPYPPCQAILPGFLTVRGGGAHSSSNAMFSACASWGGCCLSATSALQSDNPGEYFLCAVDPYRTCRRSGASSMRAVLQRTRRECGWLPGLIGVSFALLYGVKFLFVLFCLIWPDRAG